MPTVCRAGGRTSGAAALPCAPRRHPWSMCRPAVAARPQGYADLAERLLPMVVNISTSQTLKRPAADSGPAPQVTPQGSPLDDFFKDFMDRGNRPRRVQSLGSGFVIDPAGYIVTNNHVIEGADEITVILSDSTSLPATLVGRDDKTDLAVLKVKSKQPLAVAKFGDSDKARVGDLVMAIGDPFGLGGTVTAGIVSARNRDINSGPYDDFIQTDAPINRGNSGGPLFNMDGEVIGINSAIYSPSGGSVGIGFAIPSNSARNVVAQLKATGKIQRGWIGVRIQQVSDDIAQSVGLDKPQGALIAGMTDGGPAAKAGMQNGDIVISFDGKPVADNRALPRMVADAQIGKTVQYGSAAQGAAQDPSDHHPETGRRRKSRERRQAGQTRRRRKAARHRQSRDDAGADFARRTAALSPRQQGCRRRGDRCGCGQSGRPEKYPGGRCDHGNRAAEGLIARRCFRKARCRAQGGAQGRPASGQPRRRTHLHRDQAAVIFTRGRHAGEDARGTKSPRSYGRG